MMALSLLSPTINTITAAAAATTTTMVISNISSSTSNYNFNFNYNYYGYHNCIGGVGFVAPPLFSPSNNQQQHRHLIPPLPPQPYPFDSSSPSPSSPHGSSSSSNNRNHRIHRRFFTTFASFSSSSVSILMSSRNLNRRSSSTLITLATIAGPGSLSDSDNNVSYPSAGTEDDDDEDDDTDHHPDEDPHPLAPPSSSSSSSSPETFHVLGLGQAMVDFSGMVTDEFLERLGLDKGTRKIINHEERGRVLRAMDGCTYKAAAGGSLSNTLVALARLGAHLPLNVAMAGSIGSDPLGEFYRTKLRRANVNFLSAPVKDGTTGTVIVLTTSDAQRTMLAYQGTSSTIDYDPYLASIISKTNILVVEGYLFELPDTIKTIKKACQVARSSGALVAVTASDVTCIERHYDDFWEIMENYADIVFANSDEARAFCHFSPEESPISSTRYLSHFVPLVSVTDGPRGSYIGVKGEALYIPPSPCVPVDTCGAGDAYASGMLYGILRGSADLKGMGTLAARVAAVVVGQQGTRLRVQDAAKLAKSFTFNLDNSSKRADVGSDQISSM